MSPGSISPDKLAICEREYQNYILSEKEIQYFEPVIENNRDDFEAIYQKELDVRFNLGAIADKQIYCFIVPSFMPEGCLIIQYNEKDYLLRYEVLEQRFWPVLYNKSDNTNSDNIIYTTSINLQIGNAVFELLNSFFDEARVKRSNGFVLDGTITRLARKKNGLVQKISTHSPSPRSRPGVAVSILDVLVKYTINRDDRLLSEVKEKIAGLG